MLVTDSPCAQKLTYYRNNNVRGMVNKIKLAVK